MAIIQASFNNGVEDEEYINMEISSLSSSNFLCYSISSPPPQQSIEFEFQMCSVDINGTEITSNSPADELFYKGKLLPLHLPPRLQMVQKLVQSSSLSTNESKTEVPFEANSSSSPLESRRVSCELNPDQMNLVLPKLKQMKQTSMITQKLKASREYLKSLFSSSSKSGCSDESCAKAAARKYMKSAKKKKKPFGSNMELADMHRRSFSGVIQRHSAAAATTTTTTNSSSFSSSSSSSSSFSSSGGGYCDLQLLKRSNSANGNWIEGAIAHCKQSQKLGICSLSDSKISVCGEQERPQLCRI